jgi:hypothetical protein
VAVYHGRKGLVYISASGTTAAASIGKLSSWSLDMPTDRVEVTAFGDSNKAYVQGLKDISGALAGFWDDTIDNLFAAADSTDGVKMYLYPSADAITKYWYGPAWLDMSVAVDVADAVKCSGTFAAAGAWGRKP